MDELEKRRMNGLMVAMRERIRLIKLDMQSKPLQFSEFELAYCLAKLAHEEMLWGKQIKTIDDRQLNEIKTLFE